MSGWDSYRAVYGAELRAAAREFSDHGWPVAVPDATTLALVTGSTFDILEVSAAIGRLMCAQVRDSGAVVPIGATPTGTWWFPISARSELPAELRAAEGIVLHTAGASVLAPPSAVPDGWVHWRVAPALCGYQVPAAEGLLHAAVEAVRWRVDHDVHPGAQRPAGVTVAMRA